MFQILSEQHICRNPEKVRQIHQRFKTWVLDLILYVADVGRGLVNLLRNDVLRQISLLSVVPDALADDMIIE